MNNDDILLGSLRDPRLHLIKPLSVTCKHKDDIVIVFCDELEEFGFGTHLTEAIEDLQASIGELYFTLKEDHNRLGFALLQTWAHLHQKVKEVDIK